MFRIIFSVLCGTFSDKYGRRGPMFLALLGYCLQLISYAVNYAYLRELSWRFLYSELIYDLCGSYLTFYLVLYSYVVDSSEPSER